MFKNEFITTIKNPPSGSTRVFEKKRVCVISRQREILERRQSHSWTQRKKARQSGDSPAPAPTMVPPNEAAAKSIMLVKSKNSAVFSVGGDSAKFFSRVKWNSTARKSISRKKTASSKRALEHDDVGMSDDSVVDYVPSRSLLKRNFAESGDERMSDGSAAEDIGSLNAMEDEIEAGIDKKKHDRKLSGAAVMTKPGKLQIDLIERDQYNVQPLIECTACCGQIIKCSKCYKRITREQVTKLLEQYAREPEAPTTTNSGENQESDWLASLMKRLLRKVSSKKETMARYATRIRG